jgi:hypothetical protein
MPIRVNLLAEAHSVEESRRRDPIKRMIFLGVLLAAMMLVWSSSLKLRVMLARKEVSDRLTQIQMHTNEFEQVQINQKKMAAVKEKLDALNKMTSSRFLQGNLLNALQHVYVNGVQLQQIRVNQNYAFLPGTRSQTNGDRVIPGHPDVVKEQIVVSLDARDFSPNPGDQVNKFKEAVASASYFKTMLNKTNGVQLIILSAPQTGPDGKPFVTFTLECHFPEYLR